MVVWRTQNRMTLTGAWLDGVHRTCAVTAAVLRGTSHVTIKQRCNHLGGYSKRDVWIKLQSLIQSCIRLKRGCREQRHSCHCESLRAHLKMRRSASVYRNELYYIYMYTVSPNTIYRVGHSMFIEINYTIIICTLCHRISYIQSVSQYVVCSVCHVILG